MAYFSRGSTRNTWLIHCCVLPFFIGCTSVSESPAPAPLLETVPKEPLETVLDAQEQWLLGLTVGQSPQDLTIPAYVSDQNAPLKAVRNEFYYLLEASHKDRLYQYIQGMYPRTHVLYGLYFEAGELKALLLDQDVVDFYLCEKYFRHGGYPPAYQDKAPPLYKIEPVNEWVRKRNRLGTDFDARMVHQRRRPREGEKDMDSAEVVEAIAHLPLGVMGMSAYGASLFPPVRQLLEKKESKKERKRQQWANTASQIHPGSVTDDDLLRLMGAPVSKFGWPGGSGWVYSWPHDPNKLSFGIKNGLVMWKVSGSREVPENESTRRENVNCGEMQL